MVIACPVCTLSTLSCGEYLPSTHAVLSSIHRTTETTNTEVLL